MAALSAVLDPTGANLQLNNQTSATGYRIRDSADWGELGIQQIINTGAYRLEDIDGVLATGQVNRTITLSMRVKGSSIDDLNAKLSALAAVLAKASRYQTVDLVVTPSNSTKTTTYKVIGGTLDASYTNQLENNSLWMGTVTILALPFGLGPKQTLGSSASPLFNSAGPGSFTLTPSGDSGDVLADVTIIFSVAAAAVGAVSVAALTGNTGWTVSSDITSFSAGSGGGTRAAVSNSKYNGGAAPGYTVNSVGVIEQAYKKTYSTTDFPTGTPIRILMTADDTQVIALRRGLVQMRLAVSSGGVTQYGDWVSVPAAAGNGTSTHFLQGIDMGVFTFPPGPTGSVAFSGSTTIAIEVQDGNNVGQQLPMVFDTLIFLPDAQSLVAEWPVTQVAAATQIRVESDMLFGNSDGAPQTVLMSGPHIRTRGATRYGIWASDFPLANTSGDATYRTVKAWAEYTPRYVGLASA